MILRRLIVLVSLLAAMVCAFGADPIRVFSYGNGQVRLWLKGAPSVHATNAAGWTIEPKGAEKNKTWLDRLKAFPPADGKSSWKVLLDGVSAGKSLPGVFPLKPKATIKLLAANNTLTVKVIDSGGREKSGVFDAAGKSPDSGALLTFLAIAIDAKPEEVVAGLKKAGASSGDGAAAFESFIVFQLSKALLPPLLVDTSNGPAYVEVGSSAPAPVTPPSNTAEKPKTSAETPKSDAKDKPSGDSTVWVIYAGLITAGMVGGYVLRQLTYRPPTPSPAPAAQTSQASRLARVETELATAKQSLMEEKRLAKEFQTNNASWIKEREQTLAALEEERQAHRAAAARADQAAAALRQAQDEAQRTKNELNRQISALQRSGQSAESEKAAVGVRAKTYAELREEVAEAFNYLQSEINRPDVAAAVGYLLSYSCAELIETIATGNPVLERAMLANIERIANQFGESPHARKLAASAQKLSQGLGAGSVPESPEAHSHARHFDEILRLLRNQMQLELSPFYFGVDAAGKAHAVYV